MEAILKENMNIQGFLRIQEGHASNIQYDHEGKLLNYDFKAKKDLGFQENKICYGGYSFIMSNGWGADLAIAAGNGLTTGANAPSNNDIVLNSEISSGRFLIPSSSNTGKDRINLNTVTVQTLWPRGQSYVGNITEWGLFANIKGANLQTANSSYLVSRIAQNYTRTAGFDLNLTWVIVSNS